LGSYPIEEDKMKSLDYCQGLRSYGVYAFDKYPEWRVLVTEIVSKNNNQENYLKGFAFTFDGRMETMVELKLPLMGQEVGYVYKPNFAYSLYLDFHNRK